MAANGDLRLGSKECFLKLEGQVLAQVSAALHAIAAAATTSAEHVAEAKELAEDVAEILEYARVEAHPL